MSKKVFDGAYSSLLQGVSEQLPAVRAAGQNTSQVNMLSDPQTGLRRRPGAKYVHDFTDTSNPLDKLIATEAVIGGQQVNVFVNTGSGKVWIKALAGTGIAELTSPYLTASSRSRIRFANMTDELFILNTERVPVPEYASTSIDTSIRGFFFVAAGGFNKKFDVRVRVGAVDYNGTFLTPNGTGSTDAVLSAAQNIADRLRLSLVADGLTGVADVFIKGGYVFIRSKNPALAVSVSSDTGSVYVTTSGQSYMRQSSDLPATLPAEAEGYVVKVGDSKYPVYYTWRNATQQWVESGMSNDITGLANMPVSIVYSGGWSIDASSYEGRYAGDDETNPTHGFVTNGITGISSHQGRLVLLSRSMVSFSASNNPRRFWRSTVTSILDADPIETGSSQLTNAVFEYAVPFNKDLLVFSERAQAVVPTGNVVLTPRNAAVVPMTTYATDMSSSPLATGRTVMYCVPRSDSAYGVMEMVPSSTTDSQYTSLDSTAHIPKYMQGKCRFSMTSPIARMVLFASSTEKNVLYVHEHLWDTEAKQQAAWHKWVFPLNIAYAFFTNNTITIVFSVGPTVVVCTIDPRLQYSERVPFMDLHSVINMTPLEYTGTTPMWLYKEYTSTGTMPMWLYKTLADPGNIRLAVADGDLKGQQLEASVLGVFVTANSLVESAYVGYPYESSFTPTEPVLRDYKDRPNMGGKLFLLRLYMQANNTGEFDVAVEAPTYDDTYPQSAVLWHSYELELGVSPISQAVSLTIPIRADARTTDVTFKCSELTEMNLTGLDYTLQYMAKLTRR